MVLRRNPSKKKFGFGDSYLLGNLSVSMGTPSHPFIDGFSLISRATALVPPTPLMGGMAVERKEHGDRIQK